MSGTESYRVGVWMRVPVPCEMGWRVVVRASRSADSTSVGLTDLWAIVQTRERNYSSIDSLVDLRLDDDGSAHVVSGLALGPRSLWCIGFKLEPSDLLANRSSTSLSHRLLSEKIEAEQP